MSDMTNIVRIVDGKNENIEPTHESLICISLKNNRAVKKCRLFEKCQYFVVSNRSKAINNVKHSVYDFASDRTLKLEISYEIRCERGQEVFLAEKLSKSSYSLFDFVNHLINEYLTERSEKNRKDFIDEFETLKSSLSDGLREKLYNELGLIAQFKTEHILPVLVDDDELSVKGFAHLKGHEERVKVGFEVSAVIFTLPMYSPAMPTDKGKKEHKLESIEEIVKKEVRDFMMDNITVSKYYLINQEETISEIKNRISEKLFKFGRNISELRIKYKGEPLETLRNEEINLKDKVSIELDGAAANVNITNKIQIKITDASKYISAGSIPVEDWVGDELKRLCSNIAFGMDYIKLLTDVDSAESKIKKEMTSAAKDIGLDIKLISTFVDLPHRSLQEDFDIKVDKNFATKIDGHTIKVLVNSAIYLPELASILDLIKKGLSVKDIVDHIEKTIEAVVQRKMLQFQPNEFYSKYFDNEKDISIEYSLENLVNKTLADVFGAKVVGIVCRLGKDDVAKRYEELIKAEAKKFEITISSLSGTGGEEIVLSGKFKVTSMVQTSNTWAEFLKQNFTIDNVLTVIEDALSAKFKLLPDELLKFSDLKTMNKIETLAKKIASDRVRELYGVEIDLFEFSRKTTEYEKELNKTINDIKLEELKDNKDRYEQSILNRKSLRKNNEDILKQQLQNRLQNNITLDNLDDEPFDMSMEDIKGKLKSDEKVNMIENLFDQEKENDFNNLVEKNINPRSSVPSITSDKDLDETLDEFERLLISPNKLDSRNRIEKE